MSTSESAATGTAPPPPKYKRKLRNYLIDVGLQVRYTGFIIGIAVLLTAVLGYQIFKVTQDTSKIILITGLVDPAAAGELQAQFNANDRVVLFAIVGFGVLLVLSTAAAGIWITHKVAGPLYSIEGICARVRDNKLHPSLRQQLRKGDELKEFYSTFREMYEALRMRADRDITTLNDAIARLEQAGIASGPAAETLEQLRQMRSEKASSLEP
jgi:hypothetical protein